MDALLRFLVLLSATLLTAEPMEKSSMYVKNAGSEDMQTSGTGYDYQVHSGQPFTFPSFEDDDPSSEKLIDDSSSEKLIDDASSEKLLNFDNDEISPEKLLGFDDGDDSSSKKRESYSSYPPLSYGQKKYTSTPTEIETLPLAESFVPKHYDKLVTSYGVPVSYAAYAEPIKGFEKFFSPAAPGLPKPSTYGFLDHKNFLKGGGSSYKDSKKSSRGEKGDRGFLSREAFEKALKGSHDKEQKKGFLSKSGGVKAGKFNLGGRYAGKHQKAKGYKGASFYGNDDHKKKSKTTGYHNVYHKDEYKKDHSFYDKADKGGYFRRYGDYDARRGQKEGAFKKGGRHGSGYKQGDFGAKGYKDKGKFQDESEGYKKASGRDKYYQNKAEWAKKGGRAFGKEGGYQEGDKFKF
ncbi:hypothetical protein NQ315_007864 [Exocentrus adspersus]|uniref:Uncharacterized protein n=1 Tax=Exocentrus adspersus TaxID=1586481 RepID=A0AAV8W8U1_9CUCU|nr:hypothetical protein NQ315_007864 [Exocentrus adspersus]